MNKAYSRLLIANILLFVVSYLNSLYNFFNSYTIILFLLLYVIFLYYFIGYEKNNKRYQNDIFIKLMIYGLIYYIITYLLGLFIGFEKTGYSLTFISILKNVIPLILIIPIAEIIRYIFITKGSPYKSIIIFTIVNLILLDITLYINLKDLNIIKFLLEIFIPSMAKNIFLSYIVYKVGFKPSIAYRYLFEIPLFILPIFPAFGLYIKSILGFLFPTFLLYLTYNNFKKDEKNKIQAKKTSNKYYYILIFISLIFLISTILLTSGLLKYYAITIGSNSMYPNIKKGDVLIIEKLEYQELEELKEKKVLVFNHDGIIMVHRIVKILEVNGNKYFYTKGDNNNSPDGYPIPEKDVIGTPLIKIPYIGNLTVQVNELIK